MLRLRFANWLVQDVVVARFARYDWFRTSWLKAASDFDWYVQGK